LKNGFIEQVEVRNNGRFGKHYIRVNYMSTIPTGYTETDTPNTEDREKRITGEQEQNALRVSQEKMLQGQQANEVLKFPAGKSRASAYMENHEDKESHERARREAKEAHDFYADTAAAAENGGEKQARFLAALGGTK